ncbi:MAG: hypothetical protein Q4F00_10285 [bacterium]|nr:hypothetical protein [bacterium]
MSQEQNNQANTSSSRTGHKRLEGNKRDLCIGFAYLIALLLLLGYGGLRLCQWKTALDQAPSLSCYTPVWSSQADRLAFLQEQPTLIASQPKRSLWTVDKRAHAPAMIVKDLDPAYHIVGWFNNDDIIVLNSSDPKDDNLTLMAITLSSRSIKKYSFNDQSIKLVGSGNDELFLQRSLHNSKTNADEIELLTWSPLKPELTKITAIPNRPSVAVSIDSVTPNIDARFLAIVLRSVPKASPNSPAAPPALPPGAAPGSSSEQSAILNPNTADQGVAQYSIWVLNRFAKRLTWTNYAAVEPSSILTAWSSDSDKLAGVANYSGYTNVILYQAGKNLQTVRVRTFEKEGELVPQMRSNNTEVHLISHERVMQYDFAKNSSHVLADKSTLKLQPNFIALAKGSSALAFTALNAGGSSQLYTSALNDTVTKHVNLDGKSAPPTLLYDLASALQCAAHFWSR